MSLPETLRTPLPNVIEGGDLHPGFIRTMRAAMAVRSPRRITCGFGGTAILFDIGNSMHNNIGLTIQVFIYPHCAETTRRV